MSESTASLRRKIASAAELQSVVRTMRALAASSIHAYAQSVQALAAYHQAVELGLGACLRESHPAPAPLPHEADADRGEPVVAIVFGSDQGLVGPFNDLVVEHALKILSPLRARPEVWTVGERVRLRLEDAGLPSAGSYAVPHAVEGIAPLVGRIQVDTETPRGPGSVPRVLVFHNRPKRAALYEPVDQRLLPLDLQWQRRLAGLPWPTRCPPEVLGTGVDTLRTLVREYLFISLYRACAESLASENASRLAAMERADKNIEQMLADLHGAFHRLRQGAIDEELFDLTAGFEALSDRGESTGATCRSGPR